MSGTLQQFPSRSSSFTDKDGNISPVWFRLQLALWNRTGGGTPTATTDELQAELSAESLIRATNDTTIAAAAAAAQSTANLALPIAGGTMGGALTLAGAPGAPLQAATKAYVDAAVTGGYVLPTSSTVTLGGVKIDGTSITIAAGVISATVPIASSTTPAALGTAAIGVGTTYARADHVHQVSAGVVALNWAGGAVVTNDTFVFMPDAPRAGTIAALVYNVGSAGGSFTANVRINGVSVTSLSAVAVSVAAKNTTVSTGANTVALGDVVDVVITATAGSPANTYLALKFT